MKVRYEKADNAPEGEVRLSVGNDVYKLDDKDHRSFEVEDPQVQASLDAMAHVRRNAGVERNERQALNAQAREVNRDLRERNAAQAKADKHNAEKAPEEAALTADDVLAEKQKGSD